MTIMKNITALKAWRRHRIAVIVSVASLCLPRCLGAGEGGKLILNGIGLIVQVSSQISTGWFGAETSTITGLLKSYTFTEIGEFLVSDKITRTRFYVFRTLDNSYRYSTIVTDEGVVERSDNDPFEIGPPTGMPLTRASTLCEIGSPVRFRKTQTSQWSMILTHTVVSQTPNPFYTPPDNATVTMNFITDKHSGNCLNGVVAEGVKKTSSYGVPRNGSIIWEYPHVHYWANGGMITQH